MGNCLTEPVVTPQASLQSEASLSECDVARALADIDDSNAASLSALDQRPPTPAAVVPPTTPVVKRRQTRSADAQRLLHALTAVNPATTFSGTFHVKLRPKAKHEAYHATRDINTKDALMPVASTVAPRLASTDGSLTTQLSGSTNPFASILSRENSLDDSHTTPNGNVTEFEPRRGGGSSRKSKVTFVE